MGSSSSPATDEEWPKTWVRYPRHRKATLSDWLSGKAKAYSRNGGQSQYNPENYGTDSAVRELETACIEGGVPISIGVRRKTFYMRHPRCQIIGVCSGEETHYVFAEWLNSGEYHGRPISITALAKLGVHLQ